MMNLKILMCVVFVAIIIYAASRRLSRWRFMKGRHEVAVLELLNPLPQNIDRDKASALLYEVAKCFGLKAETLRLDDTLSPLAAIDSWTLGKGQEDLEAWLRKNGISELDRTPSTVGELINVAVPRMTNS